MTSFDIVAIGELLIDFTPKTIDGQIYFTPHPGGAPCNYLTMAARIGARAAFIGKVGDDAFGNMLKNVIENKGINTSNLVMSKEHPTTLAFVHLDSDGERSFSFYRNQTADVMLKKDEIDFERVRRARILHFGSLSFTDEPARSAVLSVLEEARTMNKVISYDPNYRPLLWQSVEEAKVQMLMGFGYATVVKVSEEELVLLSGDDDLLIGAKKLLTYGPKLLLVTLGEKGVFYITDHYSGVVTGYKTTVVDTTGAGDIFFGALMGQFAVSDALPDRISEDQLRHFLQVANAAASLCIESYGGIPSVPTMSSVMTRVQDL